VQLPGGAHHRCARKIIVPASSTRIFTSNLVVTPGSSTAASCRTASPPPSATRTRSPTCSASKHRLFSRLVARNDPRSAGAIVELRAGDGARNFRRQAEAADLLPFLATPSAGSRRIHELSRRLGQGSRRPRKLAAFQHRPIDAMRRSFGARTRCYCACGIRTDHEATSAVEGREKLARA